MPSTGRGYTPSLDQASELTPHVGIQSSAGQISCGHEACQSVSQWGGAYVDACKRRLSSLGPDESGVSTTDTREQEDESETNFSEHADHDGFYVHKRLCVSGQGRVQRRDDRRHATDAKADE